MDKNSEIYKIANRFRKARRTKKKMIVLSSIFAPLSILFLVGFYVLRGVTAGRGAGSETYGCLAGGILLGIPAIIFIALLISSLVKMKGAQKAYAKKELLEMADEIEKQLSKEKNEMLWETERAKREREEFYNMRYSAVKASNNSSNNAQDNDSSASGKEPKGSFGMQNGYYKDSKGVVRRVGEDFFDSEGIYRRQGEDYFDGKGELRSQGEDFYDAKGELRSSGEYFNDEK